MKLLTINCDVGEGIGNEKLLMPYIQSCNIACGAHAGSEALMHTVVALAKKNNVKIGAHPSYPDPINFGRKSMQLSEKELIETVQNQINTLKVIVELQSATLYHIKPHGALYNDIAKDSKLANQFLKAITPYKNEIKLYVPYQSKIAILALEQGFSILYEAFADRNYNDDLSLVSRNLKNAVITNLNEVINHIKGVFKNEIVTTVTGKKVKLKGATFCVHSDTDNAIEIVKGISEYFGNSNTI